MTSEKGYTKEIIEEYNIRLKSWGNSDSWGLNQFKTLEDMIYESSKVRIDAITLKRIFQQRTSNPQLATKNALCIFLGYSGYTEFVIKKTGKNVAPVLHADFPDSEYKPDNSEFESENKQEEYRNYSKYLKKPGKKFVYFVIGIFSLIFSFWFYEYKFKEIYTNYLISKIEFSSTRSKGIIPLTVTFNYKIPQTLFDSIYVVYEESNGDTIQKKLDKKISTVYMTYIYEGKSMCYLMYGHRTIKTLQIETRKPGWSVYIREVRGNYFSALPIEKAITNKGYLSLPIDSIPQKARTDKLFISYTFYKEKLVNGDNFICEARVRNSGLEHSIPLSDIMMYVFTDSGMHGLSINEYGYSYIKFISGENTIKGDQFNLSGFDFNPSNWHIMKIQVVNKKTTFYIDGKIVLKMDYKKSMGFANEITLRFKGCGAVDYVKVLNLNNKILFYKDFNKIE